MYVKQNTNDFIAFKSLFNKKLLKAVQDKNINKIKTILNTEYAYETNNNFYIQTKINLKIINDLLNKFNSEFNKDRLLVYKL